MRLTKSLSQSSFGTCPPQILRPPFLRGAVVAERRTRSTRRDARDHSLALILDLGARARPHGVARSRRRGLPVLLRVPPGHLRSIHVGRPGGRLVARLGGRLLWALKEGISLLVMKRSKSGRPRKRRRPSSSLRSRKSTYRVAGFARATARRAINAHIGIRTVLRRIQSRLAVEKRLGRRLLQLRLTLKLLPPRAPRRAKALALTHRPWLKLRLIWMPCMLTLKRCIRRLKPS